MRQDLRLYRVVLIAAIGVLPSLLGTQLHAETTCRGSESYVTDIGRRYDLQKPLRSGIDFLNLKNSSYRVRYFRVLIEHVGPPDSYWQLVVKDELGRPLQFFGPSDFAESKSRWSRRLPVDFAYFDLITGDRSSRNILQLNSVIEMPAVVTNPYYSVKDPNNIQYRSLYGDEVDVRLLGLGDYAGYLTTSYGTNAWSCSGVVVSKDLFLTNWHCGGDRSLPNDAYWNQEVCDSTIIDLSWDGDDESREHICSVVEALDAERDFALLRISAVSDLGELRAAPMRLDFNLQPNSEIHIVHHPLGLEKQVTANCAVLNPSLQSWTGEIGNVDFGHDCDTEGGSSGGPVFNSRGQLIGIHHAGFAVDPENCQPLDQVNKGVRIDAFLDALPRSLRGELMQYTRR